MHGINHSFGFLHYKCTSLFWQKKKKKEEDYFIKHLILHVVGQVRGDSNGLKKKKKLDSIEGYEKMTQFLT